MDREQIAQQINSQRQTTKQLGYLLMGLILMLTALAAGGGYYIYSSYDGTKIADSQSGTSTGTDSGSLPDGTDVVSTDGLDGTGTGTTDLPDGNSQGTISTGSDDDSSGIDDSGFGEDDSSGFGDNSGTDSTTAIDTTDSGSDSGNDSVNLGSDSNNTGSDSSSGFGDTDSDNSSNENTVSVKSGVEVDQTPTSRSKTTVDSHSDSTQKVAFRIVSKPSGAKVFLGTDGTYLGKTPLTKRLTVGEHKLTFVKVDYKKVSQKILAGVQKKTWVVLPTLKKKVIKLVKRPPVAVGTTKITGAKAPVGLIVPSGMVYIKGGYFLRGAGSGPEDAKPKMKIKLSPYFISHTEVTVAEYNRFLVANRLSRKRFRKDEGSKKDYKYRQPYGKLPSDYFTNPKYQDYPVVNVDWFDAYAYARWKGCRLPTEAEWEMASRGSRSNAYPWGMQAKGNEANWKFKGNIYSVSTPIRSFLRDKSEYGCYDMAGNVREWVYDWYGKHYYADSPKVNPKGRRTGQFKVIKGGSWNMTATPMYHRGYSMRRGKFNDCGFRCALYVK